MSFVTADARAMQDAFSRASFDAVIDKGTLDALLCADDDTGNAQKMMLEVARVLRPGGLYIWCSGSGPKDRQKYLDMLGAPEMYVHKISDPSGEREPMTLRDAVFAMTVEAVGSNKQLYLYIAQMPS